VYTYDYRGQLTGVRYPTTFGQWRGVSLRRNDRGVFGFELVW
jgi:hypothetical protein